MKCKPDLDEREGKLEKKLWLRSFFLKNDFMKTKGSFLLKILEQKASVGMKIISKNMRYTIHS